MRKTEVGGAFEPQRARAAAAPRLAAQGAIRTVGRGPLSCPPPAVAPNMVATAPGRPRSGAEQVQAAVALEMDDVPTLAVVPPARSAQW